MENKDIQQELRKLVSEMSAQNIYSQLTFFLIEIATKKENPYTDGSEIASIIGLLSDSYFGKVALGEINQEKTKKP